MQRVIRSPSLDRPHISYAIAYLHVTDATTSNVGTAVALAGQYLGGPVRLLLPMLPGTG